MSSLWDVAELSVEVVGVSGVKSLDPLALTFPPLVHTSLPEPENKRGTLLIKHKSPHLILKPGLAAYVPAKTMCVCVFVCWGGGRQTNVPVGTVFCRPKQCLLSLPLTHTHISLSLWCGSIGRAEMRSEAWTLEEHLCICFGLCWICHKMSVWMCIYLLQQFYPLQLFSFLKSI